MLWLLKKLGWLLLILIWGNIAALYEYGWYRESAHLCRIAETLAVMMLAVSLATGIPPTRMETTGAVVDWTVARCKQGWQWAWRGRP
jgi:hypothetical protein